MMRPQPAVWFEIIAAADGLDEVLQSIAAAGCAEMEPVSKPPAGASAPADASAHKNAIYTRVTGWTSDIERLATCLERARAHAVVHFPPAPEELKVPLILSNPGWIQPFEIFARLVGMPGRFGADPSGLLVFVAPILFGYMFGDVIQGLALVVIGLSLQWRWPMLRLMVAGGLSAIVFGFVFGAAGGLHGVLTPLWIDPLADPLPVLLVPIVFGGALLTLGLALTGLEFYWSARMRNWLRSDAGFLILYVGALLAILHPAGWLLVAAGLGVQILGKLWQERRIGAVFAALGEIIEKLVQISINTLSFVRVGAFALAHAGLSSALVAMVQDMQCSACYVLALIAGNALIILIEVLVASIQTTRLVLFEFFTRFFEPTGREFRPLPPLAGSPEEIRNVQRT
jgi:V/A-type H+/Na+-transporting ATPase subunit I